MNTITKAAYEGDIVSRLRNWRGLHLAHGGRLFEEAADEIERLRGYRDLAEADCSAAMLATERLRLTDDERLALKWVIGEALTVDGVSIQATLRGLLNRTRDASN